MRFTLGHELSEREVYAIGSIIAQWGFIESEIFEQTLLSFGENEEIPNSVKANMQFSRILDLWLKRVVEVQDDPRKTVLTLQYEKIRSLGEFRQAVVHSRWEWRPDAPDEVTAVRVRRKSIKRVKFTFNDLIDFATSLGEVRYLIRYPSGLEDRAEEMTRSGLYISRLGWDLLAGRMTLDGSNKRGESR